LGFPEKIHTLVTDGFLENLSGGGGFERLWKSRQEEFEPEKLFFGDHFQVNVTLNF